MVTRAEKISKDFALQFKKKMDNRRSSSLPLTAQADFAYLLKLVAGTAEEDKNVLRQRRVLDIIRATTVSGYTKVAV